MNNYSSLNRSKVQERKGYGKIYYLEHREELLNYGKIWRLEHPEYVSNYGKVWRLEHPDYNKVWRYYYKIRRMLKINRRTNVG